MEAWEPLPPRKSRNRRGRFVSESPMSNLGEGPDCKAEEKGKEVGYENEILGKRTMEDNIEQRAKQVWAHQSLESRDGCASKKLCVFPLLYLDPSPILTCT